MDFSVTDLVLLPLILGLVEFAKKLGIEGKWSMLLAVVLGCGFGALLMAMQESLIPEAALPWINVGVFGLSFGLGAAGLYDIGKRFGMD